MAVSKNAENTLIVSVTEALQEGSASKFGIVFPKDWDAKTLALLDERTISHIRKNLDFGGITQFFANEIAFTLLSNGVELSDGADVKITSLPGFGEPLETGKQLVSSLVSLPRQYRLIIRACAELSERVKRKDVNIQIFDRLRLLSGSQITDSFSLANSSALLDEYIKERGTGANTKIASIEPESLYLEFRSTGCVSSQRATKISQDFQDYVRAFYGAMIAYSIIDDWDYKNANVVPVVAISRISEDTEDLCYISRADDDLIKSVNFATSIDTDFVIDKKKLTLEDMLKPVVSMFSSNDNAKLITAAIWILRASLSSRQMDKVLESAIAIEVLLGDRETSDRIGLSKLIANRCAYSLGRSSGERSQITEFFSRFYKARSDIVHNGIFKIDEDEKAVVSEGLELAKRILRHEVEMASK